MRLRVLKSVTDVRDLCAELFRSSGQERMHDRIAQGETCVNPLWYRHDAQSGGYSSHPWVGSMLLVVHTLSPPGYTLPASLYTTCTPIGAQWCIFHTQRRTEVLIQHPEVYTGLTHPEVYTGITHPEVLTAYPPP